MSQRPIGQMSIDTRTLIDRLELVAFGEQVTYAELTALIGIDVQDKGRHLLGSARRFLLHEHRMVFGVIRDEGLKRLNDEEIADTRIPAEAHIKRCSKKAGTVLLAANYDLLDQKKRAELNAGIVQLRLHELVASERTEKRLLAAGDKPKQLSTEDLLKETMRNFE